MFGLVLLMPYLQIWGYYLCWWLLIDRLPHPPPRAPFPFIDNFGQRLSQASAGTVFYCLKTKDMITCRCTSMWISIVFFFFKHLSLICLQKWTEFIKAVWQKTSMEPTGSLVLVNNVLFQLFNLFRNTLRTYQILG